MSSPFQITLLVVAATVCGSLSAQEKLKTYYFGNSLTAGTAPKFHDELAKGRGDVWETDQFGVAGGRLQQYVDFLFPEYPDMAMPDPSKGRPFKNALETRKTIEGDAVFDKFVIQPHQAHLVQFMNWVDREAGDITEGSKMVRWLRANQPQAQIYLFQPWTVPQWTDGDQEDPNWETFDYERYWLRPYIDPAVDPEPASDPFPSRIMRTQDYHNKLHDALNEQNADVLGDQPILVIPVGDVMLELDRRFKAGTFVDADGKPFEVIRRTVIVDNEQDKNFKDIKREEILLDDISIFYQDYQHHNPGLPRYFSAAVFYAVLFGEKPEGLNFEPYNSFPKRNDDWKIVMESGYNWRAGDNRIHIEVTQDVADALAEVIWEVVSDHPRTGLNNEFR